VLRRLAIRLLLGSVCTHLLEIARQIVAATEDEAAGRVVARHEDDFTGVALLHA
jgi:hypothetical protein